MIPNRTYSPEDILRLIWKRKWLILLPFALIGTGTVLVAERLPNWYRSETLILVVPQRIPTEYVRSTVTARIEDRLQTISQQILSRTRLERIIQDLGLVHDQRQNLPMEDVIARMRAQIQVQLVQGNAFRVSYESGDPEAARAVTERLASLFIDENLRDREVLAAGTSAFLESQLQEARYRLVQHEQTLEAYKRSHGGELPSQLGANLQVIQGLQLRLQGLSDSINRDSDRLVAVERLIDDAFQDAEMLVASEETLEDAPASVRLTAARNALRNLEMRLTTNHPDIARTERLIKDLEEEAALEQQMLPETAGQGGASFVQPTEAARRRRLRELEDERDSLKRRINDSRLAQRHTEERIAEYQVRVENVPKREAELVELTRDYDTLRQSYETLLAKREESKIAENLERRQIGEQFKVLDPANLPQRPVRPDRLLINLMGAAAGLLIGLGLVGFLEYKDQSMKSPADVRAVLSVPVLASVPMLTTSSERLRGRVGRIVLSTFGCLLLATCAGIVVRTLL